MGFISEDDGKSYNLCHCMLSSYPSSRSITHYYSVWSNFEIADMDFWRGDAYSDYFDYLDSKGGFYYEVISISPHNPLHQYLIISRRSDGETRPYTASPHRYSYGKIRFNSGTRSGTSTRRSHTVRARKTTGRMESARAINGQASVRLTSH